MRFLEFLLILALMAGLGAVTYDDLHRRKTDVAVANADQRQCQSEITDSVRAGVAIAHAARVHPHSSEQPLVTPAEIENAL